MGLQLFLRPDDPVPDARTPGTFTDPRGVKHTRKAVRRLGFRHCFAEDDLYTAKFGAADSTAIEQQFFADIDNKGRHVCRILFKVLTSVGLSQRISGYAAEYEHPETPNSEGACLAHRTVKKMQIKTQSYNSSHDAAPRPGRKAAKPLLHIEGPSPTFRSQTAA